MEDLADALGLGDKFYVVGFGFLVFFNFRIDDGCLRFFFLAIRRQIILWFGYAALGSGREALEFRVTLAKRQVSLSAKTRKTLQTHFSITS